MHDSFIVYPVPRNLNFAYTFGGILTMMLGLQIATGIVLAMHYAADTNLERTGRKQTVIIEGQRFQTSDHLGMQPVIAVRLN
ncbi:quinol-cytochrome oxidoreductase complex cytochrome b subunit [Mesorhizobium shonense]|uniref:Quinol-cytochrome oxidoreductase complex cytochrome b subunit n=1 Tax=Mesorhizobium shonense TaxID=1209948 RepID=A0ABV2HSQ1_9HYPH